MKTFEQFCRTRNADPMMHVKINEQDYEDIQEDAQVKLQSENAELKSRVEKLLEDDEMKEARASL